MAEESKQLLDDGGPGFPQAGSMMPSHAQGMSLRDWFAGMAMQPAYRMAVRDNDYYAEQDHQKGFGKGDAVARNAYAIADAMLAERAKQ